MAGKAYATIPNVKSFFIFPITPNLIKKIKLKETANL